MKKILLDIAYVGTSFCGYQVQPGKDTVQQRLNDAARCLFGFECDIVGCSRTDSGVHANQFCATVTKKGESALPTSVPIEKIPQALNFHLPPSIAVKNAEWVDEDFHARYSVKAKEYVDDDCLTKMNEAAKNFIGTHDFSAFMSANSGVATTVRTVIDACVYREGDSIYFKVSADGFLYNMVRIFTGTLISVAEGKLEAEDIPSIIKEKNRSRAGVTAPPQGLYLNKVIY